MPDDDKVWHPAKFSARCIAEIAFLIERYRPAGRPGRVLDPFAGVGGVHGLQAHGWETVGVEEIGLWADEHPDTIHGDSTDLCPGLFAPETFDLVVTSPTWGNGMNQRSPHPNAGSGKRYSYADAAGQVMSATNTAGARFGKTDRGEYRKLHLRIWPQVARVLRPGGVLVLNSRDSTNGPEIRDATGWHVERLQAQGMRLGTFSTVDAPGLRYGERRRWVGDGELLILLHKTDVRFRR